MDEECPALIFVFFPKRVAYFSGMERVANKVRSFQAAEAWDVEQQLRMTPRERQAAARRLKDRVYGKNIKDVRACHGNG